MDVDKQYEYNVTFEVPVRVTCRVRAARFVDAMEAARIQFANDGLEAYYMEYEVMDQGVIKRVEEV
jgi:hypothetical protein